MVGWPNVYVCSPMSLWWDRCQRASTLMDQLGKSRPREGPSQGLREATQVGSGGQSRETGHGCAGWEFIEEGTAPVRVFRARWASRHTGLGALPAAGGSPSAKQLGAMRVHTTNPAYQLQLPSLRGPLTATTPLPLPQGPSAALQAWTSPLYLSDRKVLCLHRSCLEGPMHSSLHPSSSSLCLQLSCPPAGPPAPRDPLTTHHPSSRVGRGCCSQEPSSKLKQTRAPQTQGCYRPQSGPYRDQGGASPSFYF